MVANAAEISDANARLENRRQSGKETVARKRGALMAPPATRLENAKDIALFNARI